MIFLFRENGFAVLAFVELLARLALGPLGWGPLFVFGVVRLGGVWFLFLWRWFILNCFCFFGEVMSYGG